MNRIARVACAAATTVVLASLTPMSPASSVPDQGAREAASATYKVIARINRSEVVAGEDTVRITGKVKPKAAGQKVLLQQRPEGSNRWRKSGTARIKPSGRFVLKDEPSKPGVRFYRVVKPAGGGLKAGTSRELQLDVWAWERLAWRAVGANAGIWVDSYTVLGAEGYDDSLVLKTAGTAGYAEFTLGRSCRSLRATYALTDDSVTGATGSVAVSVDGTVVATHPLATGTIVEDEVVDLTNAFRVRFDLVGSATPAGRSAVGFPEVLCLP
ncbi:hypothetical protein GCM10011376_24260 [Nocardioides flavus (ex Wang et al. 2016)]|uniref:NPCBM/NEW2 domain-containing protein n=1 Tax=Nocardioides flavus (ex Wang et al. 2016) TaxID=2058780 RepID=A0ABQ3HJS6_9ACTN|nr:hypothetical protein [Nocardioides flavus (ex Wang et al. 2016)]GHE17816.1 hypothetical protein GCM10011376_24260 [Nocardioides flavus (ex Wang et al. 2016)]